MSTYYISACHDCKERVMWSKVVQWQAEKWHKTFHMGHNTEFSNDYDEDFEDRIWRYKDLGIQDGKECSHERKFSYNHGYHTVCLDCKEEL